MRKILSILLAACMAMSLAGCCLNHDWKDATCTEPKTCSKCGETEGDPLGHEWKDATCTEPKTCSRCGATEGQAAGHKWKEANCTTPKTCTVCGKTEGKASHGEGIWQKEGTEYVLYCEKCEQPIKKTDKDPLAGNTVGNFVDRYNTLCKMSIRENGSSAMQVAKEIPEDGIIDVGNGIKLEVNVGHTPVARDDKLYTANFNFMEGVTDTDEGAEQLSYFIISAFPSAPQSQLDQATSYITGDTSTPPNFAKGELINFGIGIIQAKFE